MRHIQRLIAGLTLAAAVAVSAAQDTGELRTILVNRTDEAHKAVGIVVGLITPAGQQVVAQGKTAPGGTVSPDADTVYEIGSITKVFTSLLLADMVERGEVKLDDPVAKFLPATVKMPNRNGREITLLDLSTQVSGLPRLPDNLKPADPGDPYADYGPARLYEFLSGHTLARDIGEKYEYSNLGVGLLGHALSLRAGLSYEELIRRRILEPLGMNNTSITLSESQKKRLAVGTDPLLQSVKNWGLNALAGAGAIRSTTADMLKFLAASMELRETPLRASFRRMLAVRRPTGTPDLDIAMGWHIWKKYGTEIIWHNGGTGGYRSFAGFDPAKEKGIIVLCSTSFGVDDIGLHMLEPQYPVARFRPPRERKAVPVDVKILESYVGEYEVEPGFMITITQSGGHLYERATGQAQFELFAENPTEFFLKMGDVQVTFVKDALGAVTHLVLNQNGLEHTARKIKSIDGGFSHE
jgi:CubicO group peptidase (beta-lactamase class C family)